MRKQRSMGSLILRVAQCRCRVRGLIWKAAAKPASWARRSAVYGHRKCRSYCNKSTNMARLTVVLGSVTPPGRSLRAMEWSVQCASEEVPGTEARLLNLANYKVAFADGRPPEQFRRRYRGGGARDHGSRRGAVCKPGLSRLVQRRPQKSARPSSGRILE